MFRVADWGPDGKLTIRENIEEIDDTFLSFLVANIQQAERAKATAAARRLRNASSAI